MESRWKHFVCTECGAGESTSRPAKIIIMCHACRKPTMELAPDKDPLR